MKMVLVFLMVFHCHQESAQFNSVSVLLNIIFKHNLKKLLKSLEFNYCKVVKGVPKYFELF